MYSLHPCARPEFKSPIERRQSYDKQEGATHLVRGRMTQPLTQTEHCGNVADDVRQQGHDDTSDSEFDAEL